MFFDVSPRYWEVIIERRTSRTGMWTERDKARANEVLPVGFLVFGKADWQYVIEDCSAATENLLLALHSYGYGGCWIAGDIVIMQRMCVNS